MQAFFHLFRQLFLIPPFFGKKPGEEALTRRRTAQKTRKIPYYIYRPARCSAKAGAAGGGRMPPSLVLQHAGILPGRFSGPSKGFFSLAIRKAKIHYSSEAGAKSPAISAVFFVFHLFRAKSSLVKLIPKHPLLFPSGRFRFSASGIPAISGEFPPLPSVAADPRSR